MTGNSLNSALSDVRCYLCGSDDLLELVRIDQKPEYETDYHIDPSDYMRIIYQCKSCAAYINHHHLLDEDFYSGEYNQYIALGTIEKRFEKIIALPAISSDNKQRVDRIISFLSRSASFRQVPRVLDIGSGTCVFLYEMKQRGFHTTCIDPDKSAIRHARDHVGIEVVHHGDIFDFKSSTNFDLITFNKVLEHLRNPVDHVKEAVKYLKNDGILYIELPEGDRIVRDNMIDIRAEFAVEHFLIFNERSLIRLAEAGNLEIIENKIITDPSGKYTIYAFLRFSGRN